MILKWSDYLLGHPANADYNKNLISLQSLIPESENEGNAFRHLADNKFIICLTKGPDNDLQATFGHSILKKSFVDNNPTYLALTGFDVRAVPVRVTPKEIFQMTPEKKMPNFREILECRCEAEILALTKNDKRKVKNYAIIPPYLMAAFFSDEDLEPIQVFLRMIKKVKKLIGKTETLEIDNTNGDDETSDVEVLECPDLDDDDLDLGPNDPDQITLGDLTDTGELAHPLEPGFGSIFDFLYLLVSGERSLKQVHLKVCTKSATIKWADEQHERFLRQKRLGGAPQSSNTIGEDPRIAQLTDKFGNLTDIIARREQYDLEARAEKESKKKDKESGAKKFEKLPPIIKNIITMFTVVEGMTQEEVDELAPTDNALSLLEVNSGPVIKELLQNHLKSKGCMAYLQPGMCNSLKNLIIASYNDAYSPSNLCVFHCGPERVGDDVSEEDIAILTEKASINKLKKEDIAKITKNETYLPKDFWAYEHMIVNFYQLCCYIGGENCLTAKAWEKIVEHAKENQIAYKKYERDNDMFYISLCDDWMRRTQTHTHSGASGKLASLKSEHINFMPNLMDIEFHRYHVRRPFWLPRPKRKQEWNGSGNNGGGGGNTQGAGKHQQVKGPKRRNYGRGEVVINEHLEEDMKVPSAVTYKELFSPDYIGKLKYVNHEDGMHKCHNWHHGGRCWSNCDRIESHKKKLSKKEIAEGKKFVLEAFGIWSATKGKGDVPDGEPPTKDTEKEPKDEGKKNKKG